MITFKVMAQRDIEPLNHQTCKEKEKCKETKGLIREEKGLKVLKHRLKYFLHDSHLILVS